MIKILLALLTILAEIGSGQPQKANSTPPPSTEQVEQALVAASTAAACPTTPDEIADFTSVLIKALNLKASEHPAFGGVVGQHAPNSLHHSARAVDLNGDRAILVALHKALEGPRKGAFCIIQASVEEKSFHLGFANCNPKEGDCAALNSPSLDR